MPKPYPQEFRDDVVRVARAREDGVTLKQVAKDFGISESCLTNWMTQADRDAGVLRVNAIHEDLRFTKAIAKEVRAELDDLASWLGLGDVAVA